MKISMIAAACLNDTIGKDGKMPWHLPADLKYFKRTTLGHHLIMGRKTFESFGSRPLPKRTHIILSKQEGYSVPESCFKCGSLEEALAISKQAGEDEVFVIGGASIYSQALDLADRIYLTRIQATIEGDTFFPDLNPAEWQLLSTERFYKDEKNAYDMDFGVWEKLKETDVLDSRYTI